jgi:hypothetical protein
MLTLRCTQKLLRRGLVQSSGDEVPPSSLLGDWYANIIFSKPQQLVLCISERTLLPVVVVAKDPKKLPLRLAQSANELLLALGVAPELAKTEMQAMQDFRIGRTASKSVLGSLNDMVYMLEHALQSEPECSLLEHSLWLARSPCKPIGYASPDTATRALFKAATVIGEIRADDGL